MKLVLILLLIKITKIFDSLILYKVLKYSVTDPDRAGVRHLDPLLLPV